MNELLRYTRAVEDRRVEPLEQPGRLDEDERRRLSRREAAALTDWVGLAPALPFIGLGGLVVLVVPWPGLGSLFSQLRPMLITWLQDLRRLAVEIFGGRSVLGFEESILLDATWGPFIWAVGFTALFALAVGPTRRTWNRGLVLLDQQRARRR
jgi:hypothetical protein